MTEKFQHQALRIPAGWTVAYHEWLEIDSDHPDACSWLREDLLQLVHHHSRLLVDVGWYGDASGCFVAVMHDTDFTGPELACFRSRQRWEVVATVESWLTRVPAPALLHNAASSPV